MIILHIMNAPFSPPTIALTISALLLFAASLICKYGPRLTSAWRAATSPGRTIFILASLILCAYAGTKPQMSSEKAPSRTTLRGVSDILTPLSIQTSGYRFKSVSTNATPDYTRPEGAIRNERWFRHGAYEAWCRIDLAPFVFPMDDGYVSSFAVFTDGKMRPTPRDTMRELGAKTQAMLCLQGHSELWHGATENNTRLITWKNFYLEADTNRMTSIQVELSPSGDYLVRSNELVFAYERIDPNDWDGDGIPNEIDCNPQDYDGDYFGPDGTLPANANTNAYYSVSLVATGPNAEVYFAGDRPSNYADPHFIARSGVTYRVPLLIGKTYTVFSNEPIDIGDASDPETEITDIGDGSYEIVRPIYIYPSNGMHDFSMYIDPDDLEGSFVWTNSCCDIIEESPLYFSFDCNRCRCSGCTAVGYYEYEGYDVEAWGGECWGHDLDDDDDDNALDGASLVLPRYVFLNNDNDRENSEDDLRSISFSTPSTHYCSSDGQVTISCTHGADRIRLWRNSERTGSLALTQTYNATSSSGGSFYMEGIKVSAEENDVTFEMSWTDNYGRAQTITRHTTVAMVTNVLVSSQCQGESDNPPPFTGQREWMFDPQNSTNVDKHLLIPFCNVVNTNDLTVRDFDIDLTLQIIPNGLTIDGDACFYALGNTPDSGSFTCVSGTTAKFSNPKVGGIYRFGVSIDASPESQCVIVLPLAGAEVTDILRADLLRANITVSNAVSRYKLRDLATILIGGSQLSTSFTANYRGRADNFDHLTVWSYNGVNTNPELRQWRRRGDGSVATLFGVPVRIAKLTNLLTGYVAEKFGAYEWEHDFGQWFGTANDISAQHSWNTGRGIATSNDFNTATQTLVKELWSTTDDEGKTRRLWPNVNATDNYSPEAPLSLPWNEIDYDHNFYSPQFLNGINSTFRNNYQDIPTINE